MRWTTYPSSNAFLNSSVTPVPANDRRYVDTIRRPWRPWPLLPSMIVVMLTRCPWPLLPPMIVVMLTRYDDLDVRDPCCRQWSSLCWHVDGFHYMFLHRVNNNLLFIFTGNTGMYSPLGGRILYLMSPPYCCISVKPSVTISGYPMGIFPVLLIYGYREVTSTYDISWSFWNNVNASVRPP